MRVSLQIETQCDGAKLPRFTRKIATSVPDAQGMRETLRVRMNIRQ